MSAVHPCPATSRRGLRARLLALLASCSALPALAVSYTFPGALPPGCSGSSGTYTCTAGSLAYGDTVTIASPKPATITITGSFATNTSSINAGGSASDLTLIVQGTLTTGYQAVVNANVTAQVVNDSGGSVTFGGTLGATAGSLALTNLSTVAGAVSASGAVTIGQQAVVSGSVTSSTSTVSLVYGARVNGAISADAAVTLAQDSVVGGSVTSVNGAVSVGYGARVTGAISAKGDVTLAQSAQAGSTIGSTTGNLDIGYGAIVTGNVTATLGTIALGSTASVLACVKASKPNTITLGNQANAGSVCCGSTCSTSCVVNNSTYAMPAACANGLLLAKYRFEEVAYSGAAGELKDSAGAGGGPYNGRAQGAALPSPASSVPARSGSPGTCGYASLPGPTGNGGYFTVTGLPVSTASSGSNTLAFWMYWNGSDDVTPISFDVYNLWFRNNAFGFNTGSTDVYGISSAGLANGWHHVVAVFGNGAVTASKLYIDGVQKSLSQYFSLPNNSNTVGTSTLRIGTWSGNVGTSALTGRVDELRVYDYAVSAAEVATLYAETHACSSLHHLELRHASGSGLTCTPSTLTVAACQDAACSTAYTGGISGTLTATGTPTVQWLTGAGFSIAAGSSSVTEDLQVTSVGSVVLGTSGLSPTPSNATSCNFGSPSCTFTAADSGLLFDVPNHVADSTQTFNVSAVRKSDNTSACTPAFASVTKSVGFVCGYTNPTSGTLPVRVGGAALNSANSTGAACDSGGRSVSLSFNASGVASTTLQYADVGQMSLAATYTGSGSDAGLVLAGSDSFITAPASFTIGAVTAAPIKAGSAFSATVTAKNASGATTPNFGRETAPESTTLTFVKRQPTGTGAVAGSFSGSIGAFSGGAATAANLAWTEVGTGDLTATLASGSYLGTGLTASGTTGTGGAVGRFIPHHFDVTASAACGSFSYAGQPFAATVTARNAANSRTVNYDGSAGTTPNFAKAVTLAEPTPLGVGTLSGSSVAAAAFSAGIASGTPTYTYSTKTTGPKSLVLRATDTDAVSSSGYAEPAMPLRSGRLRLVNGFGAETQALQLAVIADYWSGNTWVVNSADGCTTLPAAAVAKSNQRDRSGNPTSSWSTTASAITLTAGQGQLTLSAPGSGNTGTLDLALNLGATAADQSCLATHPASSGAGLAWLRSLQGSCAATWDRDPAARASFGIFGPETRKTIHVRELY